MFYGNYLWFIFCNKLSCSFKHHKYVCSASDRQCRLSSLYRKRNVRRKTFKESSYSDSNFTYTKNRNRFIQTPNIWPSRPVTFNEIGDIDKEDPKDTTFIILLFPKFPRYWCVRRKRSHHRGACIFRVCPMVYKKVHL